jgi:hypothetical protein
MRDWIRKFYKKHEQNIICLLIFGWIVIFLLLAGLLIRTINFGYQTDWVAITAFATWVLAGSVGIAVYQIFETRKSTNAQIAMEIFKELRSEYTVHKLQAIYKREKHDFEQLNDYEKDDILYILDRFEILGVLVKKGIVDEDIAINAYGGASALRCWYKLHHYIKEMSEKRGPWKINYEIYARRCLEYFTTEKIEVKFRIEDKSPDVKDIDILAELRKPEIKPRTSEEIQKQRRT